MGIDYATWRARVGLNNYRQCRYYHPPPVQWRAARWGVGEVMNDTPLVLQGCIVVVSLMLILEYVFQSWRICPKGRGRCDKVRCPKLGGGCVLSAEARGMMGVACGVHLMLQLCVVVLALLLMAGDVERNPGPLKKEGSLTSELIEKSNPELRVFKLYFSKLTAAIPHPEQLAIELYSQDVVSKEVRDEAMQIMGSAAYYRTAKLLSAVEGPIQLKPGTLDTFLSVLRGDPSLVYLADAMSDDYRLLSPPKSVGACLPTLSQLSAELKEFKHWYLLGLQLNISKDTLDSIELSHDTKVRRCVEMIQHWMNNSKTPMWGTVHEALRNIGESVLAAKIAHKYDIQPSNSDEDDPKSGQSAGITSKEMSAMSITNIHRTVRTSEGNVRSEHSGVGSIIEERSLVPISEQSSSSNSIKGSLTAAAKPKHLKIITREQWRVSAYFATVMRKITKILAQHVQLDDLVSFLQFQCHPLNPEALYVDRHILQHISNVSEVIKSLVPDYINYMDIGLLEAIVESFEVEEAQDLLQEYHDRYPHLRQLSDMPDPVPDERLDLTRRKRLRAKCDGDFESARANDVKRIRMSIESATGIDHRFVTPAQHSEGSLILTFLIPESVSGIFKELCDEDLEILAESGIVELHIDDVIISDIQKYCPQTTGSSTHSTNVPSADQRGATVKGFDSYIEHREEKFTSKEKAQLTHLLNDVPKSRLKEVCTDSFLQQLAPHITDWRILAPSFGISDHGAEKLAHCYPDIDEQRCMALQQWKQTAPETATYGSLVACLLAHAPFRLAEAALMTLTPDAGVQEARKLLQGAYLLQDSQPLWAGAPTLLQFDRRLRRVIEDTPNSEQLKHIDYSSQFETLEQFSSEAETLSIKCFLNSVTEKKERFFHIKGPPGSGKTSFLQSVCAFWARRFCLRKFTLVLWLSLNSYLSEPLITSLRSLLNYCLPQGSHMDSIEQWVCRHEGEGVLVVIDGIDNQHLQFVDYVLTEKRLKKATTVLAASCTLSYPSSQQYTYMYETQYHLLGLSQEQILKQVIQHYHHNTSKAEEFLMYISETHTIRSLCSSPPYLATVLFVFDNVNTSDLPNTWTQLFTRLLKLLGLSSDTPNTQSRLLTRLLRRSTVSDHDTLAVLTSKAYAVTSNNSSFNWHDCFTNFCNRITSPYRTMVAPADHCCFTLLLLQHYLCARHIRTLPRKQRRAILSEVPLHVRQFYVGLRNSVKRVKLLLKYPDTLMSVACMSEIPLEGLQYLMSSQLTFNHRQLTASDIQSILQAVYHSGLPCNLQFHSCFFGAQAVKMILKGLPLLPSGGTVQKLSLGDSNISDSGASVLAEVNQCLQKLDLSQNNISDSGACVLAETLKVSQYLQKLDLSENNISDSGACVLAETLKVNQCLQKLDLSHNTISDKGAYVLATALQVSRSLQELHLYQNKISYSGLHVLTEALQLDQRLQRLILWESKSSVKGASALGNQELDLHHCNISYEEVSMLAGVLEINKSLQKLHLRDSNISDDGVHALSEALKVNQSLQGLYLRDSKISGNGVHALSEALKVNQNLQELFLSDNEISDDGVYTLSEALKVNQSLQELDISYNKISSDGACALSGALEVNQSLLKINLSHNKISDWGVHALSEALKVNQSLQELDLSHNKISGDGARALSGALKVNQSLLKINLWSNTISDWGVPALSEALKVNWSLQELDLSWNYISSRGKSALLAANRKNKNLKINFGY